MATACACAVAPRDREIARLGRLYYPEDQLSISALREIAAEIVRGERCC